MRKNLKIQQRTDRIHLIKKTPSDLTIMESQMNFLRNDYMITKD